MCLQNHPGSPKGCGTSLGDCHWYLNPGGLGMFCSGIGDGGPGTASCGTNFRPPTGSRLGPGRGGGAADYQADPGLLPVRGASLLTMVGDSITSALEKLPVLQVPTGTPSLSPGLRQSCSYYPKTRKTGSRVLQTDK